MIKDIKLEQDFLEYYLSQRIKLKPNQDPWLTCEAGVMRDCVKKKDVTYTIPDGYVREEHFDYSTSLKKGNATVKWKDPYDNESAVISIEIDANRPDGRAHAEITGVYAIPK